MEMEFTYPRAPVYFTTIAYFNNAGRIRLIRDVFTKYINVIEREKNDGVQRIYAGLFYGSVEKLYFTIWLGARLIIIYYIYIYIRNDA